ncbi:MAG: ferric reductase-like transmembrane domain-containing protein [Anaerolineales bacterium]
MKRNIGNLFIIGLVVLNGIVWMVFPPENDGRENFVRQYAGEIIGSTNIILMAVSLFLSTRPKWAEPYFGGLDKMYVTHRHTSTAAFLLIFVHILTVPISAHWVLGNYLAVIAATGIVTLVLLSLAPRIPYLNRITGGTYEGWKNLKRYIGIFFIIAYIHALTIANPLHAFIAINWVQIFFIIGAGSYLYTELFGRFFKKYLPYTVEAVNHPNGSTTEVVLRAKKNPIQRQRAGQFLFVRFPGDRTLNESHPFTISSAPHEDVLRITVKASGDFTQTLFSNLKPGMEAIVEGAHGMFDYKTGGQKQIWIAGGIGLTPFLSFLRDMDGNLKQDVELYYTIRHKEEALFLDEIESAAKKNSCLRAHVRFSATDGSLSMDEIIKNADGNVNGHHVYMCGPLAMVQAFEKKFLALGVPAKNIHYEEFNFR